MYIVRTSIDDKIKASEIAHKLVAKHAAVSVHIREVNSVYQWDGKVEDVTEYEVEAIVSDTDHAKKVISEYHTYEVPEFIVSNIVGSDNIENWCSNWCKK